jgi:hypothetical protein
MITQEMNIHVLETKLVQQTVAYCIHHYCTKVALQYYQGKGTINVHHQSRWHNEPHHHQVQQVQEAS